MHKDYIATHLESIRRFAIEKTIIYIDEKGRKYTFSAIHKLSMTITYKGRSEYYDLTKFSGKKIIELYRIAFAAYMA